MNLVAWRLWKGGVVVRMSGSEVSARAGQWVVTTRGRRYQEFTPGAEIDSFHLQLETGVAEWEGPGVALLAGASALDEAAAVLGEALREHRGGGVQLGGPIFHPADFISQATTQERLWRFVAGLFSRLAAEGVALREPAITDARVARSLAIIDALPLDVAWDRERVARAAGVSASHLDRLWREQWGRTPFEHWEGRRVRFARRKLENTTARIKEVALDLGFAHLAHFSNWFRARAGASPREYRGRFLA